jgi:hypothetical protein
LRRGALSFPDGAAENLDSHANVPRFGFRPIFYNSRCHIRAYRAFERAFVVAGLIRLDTGEPHLCLAEFTKRTADDPLLGKCLIFPHATPFEWLAWQYTQTESFNKKEPASGLARLLSTNRGNRPRLFTRVINNCASKFTLPFEFDRNVASRFHPGTGNHVNAISTQAQLGRSHLRQHSVSSFRFARTQGMADGSYRARSRTLAIPACKRAPGTNLPPTPNMPVKSGT